MYSRERERERNLLSELRARLAFGETCDLRHIEKQGAQGVGCVGVERLQTAPESSVAVTVRSATHTNVASEQLGRAALNVTGLFECPLQAELRISILSCLLQCFSCGDEQRFIWWSVKSRGNIKFGRIAVLRTLT